jgi:hypothetical protein
MTSPKTNPDQPATTPKRSSLKAAEADPSNGRPCPELGIMPTSESTLLQASTKVGDDTKDANDGALTTPKAVKHVVHSATAQDIFLFLGAFRILNALTIRTFFQPDEYFQSLEPAWQMAFGRNSGAWITWVSAANDVPTNWLANSSPGMEEPPTVCYSSFNLRSYLLDL